NSTEVEPLPVGFTGVTVRVLFQGADCGGLVVLARMAPGAVIPEHWHSRAGETGYVLDGGFGQGGLTHGPGPVFFGQAGGPPRAPHELRGLHRAHAFPRGGRP